MSKEAAKAPKERVNIVYKPATGNANEEVELPFKTLMLGDFTGRQNDTPLEDRRPINVDKDNFGEVMRSQQLQVDVQVRDTLSGETDASLAVKLDIGSLEDLSPAQIAEQVQPLRQLLALREALATLKGPMGNVPAFRKKMQQILQDPTDRKKLLDELSAQGDAADSAGEA